MDDRRAALGDDHGAAPLWQGFPERPRVQGVDVGVGSGVAATVVGLGVSGAASTGSAGAGAGAVEGTADGAEAAGAGAATLGAAGTGRSAGLVLTGAALVATTRIGEREPGTAGRAVRRVWSGGSFHVNVSRRSEVAGGGITSRGVVGG
jgi:hypothetical protein